MRFDAAIYNEIGQITSIAYNTTALALANQSYIEITEDCNIDDYYIHSGSVACKGVKPGEYFEFDYKSKQWVFSLDHARALKWDEVKAARTADEFGQFAWGGYVFQCDEVSQRRIQGAVQLASINPDFYIDWTLADNSVVNLGAQNMVDVGVTLAAHVNRCHEQSRALRVLIEAALNQDDLDLINYQSAV